MIDKRSLNNVILLGRLADEPCMAGNRVNFITRNSIISKDGNEEFLDHFCYTTGKQAELVKRYLHKNDLVCVEGKLTPVDSFGNVNIFCKRITFLSKKH